MSPLVQSMHKVQRRLTLQRSVRGAINAVLGAAIACCVWLIIVRLFPHLDLGIGVYGALTAVSVLGAIAWSIYTRPSVLQAALETDRRLGLQERITSSLELTGIEGPMVDAVHHDALRHCEQLNLSHSFPLTPPRSLKWLAIPIVLFGVGYVFLPEFDLFGFKARLVEAKALEAAQKVKAERIKEAVRPIREQNEKIANPEIAGMMSELERVADQIAAGELTEKQALAKLTDVNKALEEQREKLQTTKSLPELAQQLSQLSEAKELGSNILNGDLGKAADKARELQKKLQEGKLNDEEKQKLAEDMKKLSEALKSGSNGENSALSEALAKAAAKLGQSPSSMEGMDASEIAKELNMSMEDIASVLEQLDKLNEAMKEMAKMEQEQMGPSEFCRSCGEKLKPCKTGDKNCKGCGQGYQCSGSCSSCNGSGWCKNGKQGIGGNWMAGQGGKGSGGMGKRGTGQGGQVGDLPDPNDSFVPSVAQGEVTKGKFLADMIQRTAPDTENVESKAEFISGVVSEAQQEAEQAITREEIPLGSREFVRQYFGSIDPKSSDGEAPAEAVETHSADDGHDHGAESGTQ